MARGRPPSARSAKQKKNLRKLLKVSGLPEEFLQTVMGYATFAMSDLVHSKDKLRGRIGVGIGEAGAFGVAAHDFRLIGVEAAAEGDDLGRAHDMPTASISGSNRPL